MTIENASPFFAWDVASFLALFLVIAFVIVTIDQLFFNKPTVKKQAEDADQSNPSEQGNKTKEKSGFSRFVYFVLFLKFNKFEKYSHRPKIVQWSAEFFPVLLLVFVLRGFVVEPFRIPSNSMMPTFLTYDFLLVDKISYGIHLPVLNKELLDIGDPERGDVVVFRYPNYDKESHYQGADFIKRVIGLPGDKIEYTNDRLSINGEEINYQDKGLYQGIEAGIEMTGYQHRRELLDNNPHDVLLTPYKDFINTPSVKNTRYGEYIYKNYVYNSQLKQDASVNIIVPDGHYFVMGDNRANSSDGRFWGFVPETYIVGRAFYIWAHGDIGGLIAGPNRWESLKTLTFGRNGVID